MRSTQFFPVFGRALLPLTLLMGIYCLNLGLKQAVFPVSSYTCPRVRTYAGPVAWAAHREGREVKPHKTMDPSTCEKLKFNRKNRWAEAEG